MRKLLGQLTFDGKRMVWRNPGFVFMTIMMPTFFYVLFTKILNSSVPNFDVMYMGSMLTYSSIITAIMGLPAFLMRDRLQGLTTFLHLSNRKLSYYYESVFIWNTIKNIFALVVLGTTALMVNQVSLSIEQWLGITVWLIIGQIPLMLIGISLSFIDRQETLNMLSNFIAFPLAIMSGLWWPLPLLPDWIQKIGRRLPTYLINDAIGRITQNNKISSENLWEIIIWSIILFGLVLTIYRQKQRYGTVGTVNENYSSKD